MNISLKCQYAVRGVLELARHYGRAAVPISKIARPYEISTRFLEIILNQLKRGGFVGSKRGVQGGFFLAVKPKDLTIGQIVRFLDGPLDPVKCVVGRSGRDCPQKKRCVLRDMWSKARQAVERVYDSANFADLLKQEASHSGTDYSI
jgi:Rrf2 family protein